ncbi:hypothetical protein G7046_g234 [Stylonectria norvegica]|nr:hypothetical protein G7046_g234 [Stylonectria norvegica]
MDLFRVRLNCIDHYQATPTRYDPQLRNDVRPSQASKGPKVPVVRVFGSTETGQKVCAHIHGAFPYLYVEYPDSIEPEAVGAYIYRIHLSIDHALAVSYRRDQYRDNAQFVARITLVKGIPFYGFHVGYRFFLKIYMFNPVVMTRLADLLQQGVIMKRKFQPYEAHLQYLLQFMTDYNLYGCGYVDSSSTHFRAPVPSHDDGSNATYFWHDRSIPATHVTEDMSLPRVSHCSIEVDICVQNIVNRRKVKERPLHHDFVELVKPLPDDAKYVYSMAGLWKDEAKRRKLHVLHSKKQGTNSFSRDGLVSMSADIRTSQLHGWIHENEHWEQIRELVSAEKSQPNAPEYDFDTFAKKTPLEDNVKTVLQSIEDLFPSNLLPVLGLPSSLGQGDCDPASSIDVDEERVLEVGKDHDDFFPDDSDEEALTTLGTIEQLKFHLSQGSGNEPPSNNSPNTKTRHVVDVSDDGSSWEPAFGVCESGLKTGKLPSIPFHRELLDIAESDGLIGRTLPSRQPTRSTRPLLKRSGSASIFADVPTKKANGRQDKPSLESGTPWASLAKAYASDTTPSKGLLQQYAKLPSTQKDTVVYNQTLNFAIVKDQSDPSTRLRLSQKSQKSSSQNSEDLGPQKQVSFAPSTFVTADLTSSTGNLPDLSSSLLSSGLDDEGDPMVKVQQAIGSLSNQSLIFSVLPPSATSVSVTLKDYNLADVIYQNAYYKREKDVPNHAREYAGREFRLEGNTLPFLADFDSTGTLTAGYGIKRNVGLGKPGTVHEYEQQQRQCTLRAWEFAQLPPSYDEVKSWVIDKELSTFSGESTSHKSPANSKQYLSQINGPTPQNKHDFKYARKQKSTSVEHEAQYMSTMSLEIHVNTRGKFVPNPEEDEIQCVFWSLKSDETVLNSQDPSEAVQSGIIVLSSDGDFARRVRKQSSSEILEEASELDLMVRMIEIVRTCDPDILTGYEVHGSSWGYLIERARLKYDYNLCDEFSRMKTESHGRFGKESDKWGFNTTSTIRVTGRHMINIWRAMRGELNLLQYTMENVVWHLLHRRIPHYSWIDLTKWYRSGKPRDLAKLLRHYQNRTRLDIEILDANELIARTSEQARLLGVDFFSVFSRGSQYKVESIMFRIAKPENFLLVSPSRKQVGGQNALECLPLVMEPQSAFYNSPLLVLDFQSLYPSVMIAYNYCYSTFLGRITNWRGMNKMGFTEYKRQQGLLALLKDHINIAPNGMMYAKAGVRKSLLAKMLTEILETRVMIKSGMKTDKEDKTLQQLLNNRQLALKLLANVTYGYASASFSGRMPCSEIADSIVQTGRETLEKAIAYIHSVERWGAEVVYGDTDSIFVHLKGRTKDQAFDIGNEMAAAITEMNPRPMKLKFEKVYHPCVLLAKKRYVGYKYETRDQVKPEFDAKGIETVRRDGTPAEQKIEEKALRLLFETADLSQIKAYFQQQCEKIMRNTVSVQDFCFAREVRLGTYSDKGPPPAGALISTKRMLEDARAEPQYGERVPYVVITGAPGARLIDRCVAPEDLLSNPHWQLDAEYYISKNLIPPLERIFNLVGANVRQWYDDMPKIQRIRQATALGSKKTTLESYLKSTHCLVCNAKFAHEENPLCGACRANAPASLLALQTRLAIEERRYDEVVALCRSCSGLGPLEEVVCDSKDCPVFWTRMRQRTKLRGEGNASRPVIEALIERVERAALDW